MAPLARKHKGGETQELNAAIEEQLRLERELALARGDEAALAIDWRPKWDVGAPLPHVLASAGRTFLIYMVSEPDPAWDGTHVNVIDPASDAEEPLAIVEFTSCYAHRFGGPNDEVVEGHPLYGKGLEAHRAHEVANSKWLAAEQAINSVHAGYRPQKWKERSHYLLFFHDDCFECLAQGFTIDVARCSFREAVDLVVARMFDD